MNLILIRHGESEWNLLNKFTGWHDVSLTDKGKKEAHYSGQQLLKLGLEINCVYTSLLNRATETTSIIANIIKFPIEEINYEWRLNERHYGALQGLNKSEIAAKYGEDQVHLWRRSFDIPPPKVDINDKRHPINNDKFKFIGKELPSGESLEDVIYRINPFWENFVKNFLKKNGNYIIIAHSNSIRAIVKILEKLSNEDIALVNIPTGVPLVYNLTPNLDIKSKNYLISDDELIKKQIIIKNQGKAN